MKYAEKIGDQVSVFSV